MNRTTLSQAPLLGKVQRLSREGVANSVREAPGVRVDADHDIVCSHGQPRESARMRCARNTKGKQQTAVATGSHGFVPRWRGGGPGYEQTDDIGPSLYRESGSELASGERLHHAVRRHEHFQTSESGNTHAAAIGGEIRGLGKAILRGSDAGIRSCTLVPPFSNGRMKNHVNSEKHQMKNLVNFEPSRRNAEGATAIPGGGVGVSDSEARGARQRAMTWSALVGNHKRVGGCGSLATYRYLQVGFISFFRFDSHLINAGQNPIAVMRQSAT